jgi:hypothetical protein
MSSELAFFGLFFLLSIVILNDGIYCVALSGSGAGLRHVCIGYAMKLR